MTPIGICGDNCAYCPRYIATQKGAFQPLSDVKNLWVRLGFRSPDFPAQDMVCFGCRPENQCAYSEVRSCASNKCVSNCGECMQYPCSKINRVFERTEKLRSNALAICTTEEMELLDKAFFRKKHYLDQHSNKQGTILEIKNTLSGVRKEFQCIPLMVTTGEAVILYPMGHKTTILDIDIPAGSLSLGYFWENRLYNAYHWVTLAGATIGLYFNISDHTSITPKRVEWRDLIVDILITPDGRCRVIDEDELPSDIDRSLFQIIDGVRNDLISDPNKKLAEFESKTASFMDSNVLRSSV
jgi:protein associated with RNAse G/E